MLSDWSTLIAQQPMLEFIPAGLRDAARLRPFTRGETLFRQGERPRSMLYVLKGEIRLLRTIHLNFFLELPPSLKGPYFSLNLCR